MQRRLSCQYRNSCPLLLSSLDSPPNIIATAVADDDVPTIITKDAIQSMLWYPYKGITENMNKPISFTSTKNDSNSESNYLQQQSNKKFQPIVQVVNVRRIRNSFDENSDIRYPTHPEESDGEESVVLIVSDTVLSVEAVVDGNAMNTRSSSKSSTLMHQTLQPSMLIQILEYQPLFRNAINARYDSSFSIRIISFRIVSNERPSHSTIKTMMTIQRLLGEVLDQQHIHHQRQQEHDAQEVEAKEAEEEEVEIVQGMVGKSINVNIQCQSDVKFVGWVTELGNQQQSLGTFFLGLFGGTNMRYDGALILANAIRQSRCNPGLLSNLQLRDNNLGDAGTILLIDACCAVSCGLQYLDLCNNNITDIGLESVLQLLQPEKESNGANKTNVLQSLYLDGNNFSPTGIASFAVTLSNNTSLIELSLGNNNIDDDGILAIATALQNSNSTTALETLNIHSNHIGNVGITFLADVMKHNTTLRELDMRNNTFDDVGALTMYNAMQYNNTIITLRLNMDTNKNLRISNQENIEAQDGASEDEEWYSPVMVSQILNIFDYNNRLLIVDDPKLPRWIRKNVLTKQRYNRNDRAGPDRYVRPYPPPKLGLTPRNDIYQWLLLQS